MLRAWEVQEDGPGHPIVWRYALKGIGPAGWQYFADMAELISYLRKEFVEDAEQVQRLGNGST